MRVVLILSPDALCLFIFNFNYPLHLLSIRSYTSVTWCAVTMSRLYQQTACTISVHMQMSPSSLSLTYTQYLPAICPWHKWLYWAWTRRRGSNPSTPIWWCLPPPQAALPPPPSPLWWSQLETQEVRRYVTTLIPWSPETLHVTMTGSLTHHHPACWPWRFSQRSLRCCCTQSIRTEPKNNVWRHACPTFPATIKRPLV